MWSDPDPVCFEVFFYSNIRVRVNFTRIRIRVYHTRIRIPNPVGNPSKPWNLT